MSSNVPSRTKLLGLHHSPGRRLAARVTSSRRGRRTAATAAVTALVAGAGALAVWAASPSASGVATSGPASGVPSRPASGRPAVPVPVKAARKISFTMQWEKRLPAQVITSSPMPDTINGTAAVLVGTTKGQEYALSLKTGATLKGWPHTVPGKLPIMSSASSFGKQIFLGVGSFAKHTGGGYLSLSTAGKQLWFRQVTTRPGTKVKSSVGGGLAVGKLQGVMAVVGGSFGQQQLELNAKTGKVMPGFPWFQADTNISTPAIAKVVGKANQIIEGGGQTAGFGFKTHYKAGGHIRILKATGHKGFPRPNQGLICENTPNQEVDSSPAVGRFLNKKAIGIVVGTGNAAKYLKHSDTKALIAINTKCKRVWTDKLNGLTVSSPALVNALGNGGLQVAEGTWNGSKGTVYLISGGNGHVIWKHNLPGAVIGGVASANLGGGNQDLIVPTTNGLFILNGRNGVQLANLAKGKPFQNVPLVTKDANGLIGITAAGYLGTHGVVYHFQIKGTNGNLARQKGSWPMFHHDPQLTGSALG